LFPQPGRCPQGRHPAIRRDRWPCATGLASYPSSCVCLAFLQAGDRRCSAPPALGACCRFRRGHRPRIAGWFRADRSLRDGLSPLRVPVATPEPSDGMIVGPTPSGTGPPHWLAVATSVVGPPTASAGVTRNLGHAASLGLRLVSCARAVCLVTSRCAPARRHAPLFRNPGKCDLPRGGG